MRTKILFIGIIMILLVAVIPFAYGEMYEVGLKVDKINSVELTSLRVKETTYIDKSININEYRNVFLLKIISENGNNLHGIYFSPSFIIYSDPPIYINESSVLLNLPYFDDAKYLKIFFNNTEKLSVELKDSICNNDGICNNYESYYSCPNDCSICSKDNVCASKSWDGCCDEDCFYDKDCKAITNDDDKDGILNENDLCPGTNPAASLITDNGCSCEQIKEAISARGEGYAKGVLSDKNLGICRAAEAGARGLTGKIFALKIEPIIKSPMSTVLLLIVLALILILVESRKRGNRK